MHNERLVNLLGAAALAINAVMLARVHDAGAVSISGAGALVTLAVSPGISVTELGKRVGSSQSAAARLLCRLCDRGCCTRSAVCPVGQAERDRTA
ncbi:MarR family transcriptional regulator [Nocardia abscessus]|uniref:MarR family transcriptional regulator n=1 Tax=Nocardia abscessus TaxID=120957 RepID=UPI0018939D8C|nr:MarR family transcriptional regulator [Nocardia abscessus]MBF6339358.1 MarR family transcriptional regulator [Nocardia abscessus]